MKIIQLVNSVIVELAYSFQVYRRYIKLLLEMEQWIQNFVWTRHTQKRGLLTVKGFKGSILCASLLKKLIFPTNFVLIFFCRKYLLWKKNAGNCCNFFCKIFCIKHFFTTNFVENTYEFYNFLVNNYSWRNYLPIKILRKNRRKKYFLTNSFNKFTRKISCNMIIFSSGSKLNGGL